ncbi:MAG TPA: hypothetical protein VIK13_12160 [Candidatus Limnocylindrales bacterium]
MDMYDRPSPAARGDALLRLRTVTTGVAIAGIAGIAGFGIAAASGYRGTSTSGANATPVPFQQQQVIPNDDGFTAPAPNTGVQPPTQSNGRHSHTTSGGSGG